MANLISVTFPRLRLGAIYQSFSLPFPSPPLCDYDHNLALLTQKILAYLFVG